ncbi:hypothetical protein JQ634_08920 [Bradyrhizobium sp. AUGA SZCCT0240]|uniref:hypothetical protein n=1 Tax=unclassified Bradyrhizobium TaxID=2631580 RepID=UPI001BA6537F|nr:MULTISPECIES: hypothetical protein [unclassified Bradyrhizobium]MBR1198365.1 hypothetical protein [Bradyrhizobium sp. AUGA SZCCT0158]MBR1243047.1 hypothetical protein [Bradyrhizobium sp. AUGA SZCCT0274]MBR1253821.1 hypothetical protein [Bradyrhizobium sp. AUGA SZCCT0240]
MFEWLKEGARGAVSAATKGVTEAAAALKALADSMARRAAEAADLGKLLDILDKVPGVDFQRREPDAAYLATMMAAFQMGELSLVVTCTGPKSTDIEILRMMPLAAAEADALVGSPKFGATVLAEGQEGRPAIQMLMNRENLAQNYHHVSVDALIKGLMKPIENVPFVGGVLAAALGLVARPIARLILDIIFTQAENIIRYARGGNAVLPAPTEQPHLPSTVEEKPDLVAGAEEEEKRALGQIEPLASQQGTADEVSSDIRNPGR